MSELFTGNASSAGKRQARTEKELSEKRKIRRRAIIVVLIVAILFGTAMFFNSNFVRRNLMAVRIGQFEFTATQFDFFFNSTIIEYRNVGQQPDQPFPDFTRPLVGQRNFATDQYWTEYFVDLTFQNMHDTALLNYHADIYGFALSAEHLRQIEEEMAELRMIAQWQAPSFIDFLRFTYSLSITESIFENMMRFTFRARAFEEHMAESFTFEQHELDAAYNERRNDFDLFVFRQFLIHPEPVDFAEFEPGVEGHLILEAQAENAAVAAALAHEIVAEIATLEDFIEQARLQNDPWGFHEHDDDDTLEELMGQHLPHEFRDWFFDSARMYGDVAVLEFGDDFAIVYFIERNDNSYLMREMRQILIMRDFFMDHDEEDQVMARIIADMEASVEANAVLGLFVDGGATEQHLISLMPAHSHDNTEGGLYTNIARSFTNSGEIQLVPEISRWLFEDGRRIGDFELIRTEAFGYHLVFLSGFGERYRDFLADHILRQRDSEQWRDSLAPLSVTRHWAMIFTQA